MISTGTLMLGKALLTAGAIMGFLLWQLRVLRRMREEDAARKAAAEQTDPRLTEDEPRSPDQGAS
jgi:hypothetical protein